MSTLATPVLPGASSARVIPLRLPLTALQKLLLSLGAIGFDVLFWNQNVGLNVALYTLFVVVGTLVGLPAHAPQWRSTTFRATLLGTLLSAGLVVWYASGAAKLACVASLTIWLGYRNQPHLKLVAYALLTALGNLLRVVPAVLSGLLHILHISRTSSSPWGGRVRFYARLLVLPLVVLFVFHILFSMANPVYSQLSSKVLAQLGDWLTWLLSGISVPHLLFFLVGLSVTIGALVVVPFHFFADSESRFGEFVRRQRNRVASFGVRQPDFSRRTFRTLDLRKEYLAALAVFGLVNLLLLAVNAIDISWIWFGFTPGPSLDLTQFVHEGTYVLILSILVAMGIMLWFFRRNLNFYGRGLSALRWGATVWVVQNAVLVISVGLRNYYYILYSGLAYKRIGVYGFLLLTLFGLGTILLKVWQRRSAYSLVRLNGWASYVVLLLLAAGNWEVWMVRYNLQPRFRQVDLDFLLTMPPRVLPELAARQAILDGMNSIAVTSPDGYHENHVQPAEARRLVQERVAQWLVEYGPTHRQWQSWNWAEASAYTQLTGQPTAAHSPRLSPRVRF
ncbi:DUF4153 domain-containing protein [Hymenobacter mucosus]|uniref:Uncharacterized protein n=1 Tax=Hymenobacter mucosus TaxID=1411120 RepID=A0A238W5Q0_9BACT|nr:DUF4173 domain-containing protein [Hymenobacter mucosus]SNR41925.1 protein of unknown function [Hymenobacter mucosus]